MWLMRKIEKPRQFCAKPVLKLQGQLGLILTSVCLALHVLESKSVAQSATTASGIPARQLSNATSAIERFPKGTWTLQLDGAFLHAYSSPRFEQFSGGHVALGYYLRDRFSLNLGLPAYWVNQSGPNTVAAGFDLFAKWHFLESGPFSIYLDGGAGCLAAGEQVPRRGTHFNFTEQVGIGATWMLDDHTYLFGGGRVWHLSNAGFFGSRRNPSISESLMGYAGIGWKF